MIALNLQLINTATDICETHCNTLTHTQVALLTHSRHTFTQVHAHPPARTVKNTHATSKFIVVLLHLHRAFCTILGRVCHLVVSVYVCIQLVQQFCLYTYKFLVLLFNRYLRRHFTNVKQYCRFVFTTQTAVLRAKLAANTYDC